MRQQASPQPRPPCPDCGRPATREVFPLQAPLIQAFDYHQSRHLLCEPCGLLFQDPLFSLAQIPAEQRQSEVAAQNPVGVSRLAGAVYALYYGFTRSAVLRGRRQRGRRPRLLDVGCGSGQFLKVAEPHFDVWGVDASPEACQVAREQLNLPNVHAGDLARGAARGPFDVITLFQTIEHIHSSPRELLRVVFELLAPGGVLYVAEVPNLDGLEFQLFGDRCWYLASPVHNYIFTEDYFHHTLEGLGYAGVQVDHDWKNFTISSQSLVQGLHQRSGGRLGVPARHALSALSYPLFLPINAALAGLRRAVTFSVSARRPAA